MPPKKPEPVVAEPVAEAAVDPAANDEQVLIVDAHFHHKLLPLFAYCTLVILCCSAERGAIGLDTHSQRRDQSVPCARAALRCSPSRHVK